MIKIILILIIQLLFFSNYALAQCGLHRQIETQTRQRSSVTVSSDIKNIKQFATVSKKEAKKIAISQYPGKVKKISLSREDDGTLVWKLEVKGNQGQKEIFIDPANGTFLGFGLTK